MNPVIKTRNQFIVLGIQTQIKRGSETPQLFAGIWKRFEMVRNEIESLSIDENYYGINFPTEREDVTDYLAGMMVPHDSPVPERLKKRTVPGALFVVFECPVELIGETYRYIFTTWIPNEKVSYDPTVPVFEEYPSGMPLQSILIHIPIRQKT